MYDFAVLGCGLVCCGRWPHDHGVILVKVSHDTDHAAGEPSCNPCKVSHDPAAHRLKNPKNGFHHSLGFY